ncbi:MAG TPA: acyltransferase [Euzebyales bacterium]|nr:acyltransferase [Euzebyales bacterium]
MARTPAVPPAVAPTLPDRPGIDGLRALAVAAIVVADAGVGWLAGGLLGVEIFFVITAFLVTSLLVAEQHRTGRIDVLRFWGRRGRRMLPGLLTAIGGVSILVLVTRPDELYRLGPEVRAGLAGLTNWYLVWSSGPQPSTDPSMLHHLWPVAVGVQFLAWWPLACALLLPRIGRNRLRAVAWLLACASAVAMAVVALLADLPRALYGTDTRAAGLLVGAGLALASRPGSWPARATGARARRLRIVGLVVLAALIALLAVVPPASDLALRGGVFLVAVLTAVTIVVVLRSPEFDRLLGAVPLRWVGLRSYGIYLWHWPVLIALGGPSTVARPHMFVLYVALTAATADVSYRFVEMPLCRLRPVAGTGRVGRPNLAVRAMAMACGAATVAALLTGQARPADARSLAGPPGPTTSEAPDASGP